MTPYMEFSIFSWEFHMGCSYSMPLNGLFMFSERAFGICVGCLKRDY